MQTNYMKNKWQALLLLSLITSNEALRILVVFPMASKSHSILGHGVTDRLLDAGHEVVHLTSFPKEKPVPKLREISLLHLSAEFMDEHKSNDDFKIKNIIRNPIGDSVIFLFFTYILHKRLVEDPTVVKLLSDPNEKIDAVILEWFFSELTAGIPPVVEAPLIWLGSTEPHWEILRLIDEIPNPAYNVDLFSSHRGPLDFFERALHLWKIVTKFLVINFIKVPLEYWVYNNVYPEIAAKRGVTLPSYTESIYNASLTFLNSHPSVGGAMKLPQNAINIAGYHIQDKIKPLPENIQKIMENAKNGVIYFSLGSNMQSDGMSDEMRQSLLNMFGKLEQTVIWKFESDVESGVPANVHLVKWAPQQSILAHPNLKLFITHGGQLSTIEAIHYGVPLVGIPIMGDQHINMVTVEAKGFGIKVTLAEDMAHELEVAIRKVVSDKAYKIKAQQLSSIFHNRPMKPGAELVHWVEHVVATGGAPHLRSPALTVSLYQRFYLDLFAVLAVIGFVLRKLCKFVRQKWTQFSAKKGKKE